jgi:hypothetical protein
MKPILRLFAAGLLLALSFAAAADSAAPAAATVQPAKPIRVVVQVSSDQTRQWTLALDNARNAQKDVGAANIEIEIVAYGPGLGMLRDDSLLASRVQEALAAGIRIVACRNTMKAQHLTEAEMAPGIDYAQAGVVEIIRRQMEGYAYLRP